jgi:hypothetical protein
MPKPVYRTPLEKIVAKEGGRPSKLTGDLQGKLVEAIASGLPLKSAAAIAGICYETLNRWKKKGESQNAGPEYRQFCHALEQANAAAMQYHLQNIAEKGKDDWRASAWILERRFRTDFGKDQIEQSSNPLDDTTQDYEVLSRMRKQQANMGFLAQMAEMLKQKQLERDGQEPPPIFFE